MGIAMSVYITKPAQERTAWRIAPGVHVVSKHSLSARGWYMSLAVIGIYDKFHYHSRTKPAFLPSDKRQVFTN